MKRTARIGIRLLPEEKDLIEQRADIYGLSVSDYLRVLAITHVLTVSGNAPEFLASRTSVKELEDAAS